MTIFSSAVSAGLRLLPAESATKLTISLANRSARPSVRPEEQALLGRAKPLESERLSTARGIELGAGPAVLLIHGWNGRATQMAPLARAIADAGYRAIVLDVTGQGDAPGRSTRWSYFIRDIAAAAAAVGPLHACVAHSAGALCMMAARELFGPIASRYVCIAAPSHPFPPVRAVEERLNPGNIVLRNYQAYLAGEFQRDWDALESGAAFAGAGGDLLLIHDKCDRYVSESEAHRIHNLCPGSQIHVTEGYGHVRLLAAAEVRSLVLNFIGNGERALVSQA